MELNKLALLLSLSWFMGTAMSVRELLPLEPGHDLTARLEAGGGGLVECWNALVDLRSCSNEIIGFFLNGETELGPDCCKAIRVITHQCWPAMLTSLGFTVQEGDILRGYCDAKSTSPSSFSSPAPSPSQSPILAMT